MSKTKGLLLGGICGLALGAGLIGGFAQPNGNGGTGGGPVTPNRPCTGSFCSAKSPLSGALGGTGVANTGRTLTLSGVGTAESFSFPANAQTYTMPVASGVLLSQTSTDTVTNKSLSGASNSFTLIPLSAFTNLGTTTTVLHGNAAGSPTFGAVSLSADVTGSLALSNLASQAANTVVANATSGSASPTAVAMPGCVDSAGNHLNYTSGTGFSCGTSTPAPIAVTFFATLAASQTVTSGAKTVVQYDTVVIDSGSYWDAVNFRYKPLVAGKYLVSFSLRMVGSAVSGATISNTAFVEKNGSTIVLRSGVTLAPGATLTGEGLSMHVATVLVSMNGSTDYIDIEGTDNGTGTNSFQGSSDPFTSVTITRISS